MNISDALYPDIVYTFNFVMREWVVSWRGLVEIVRLSDVTATDIMVKLAHLWACWYAGLCD